MSELAVRFGADGELFGMSYLPDSPKKRGVVLCPPFGEEAKTRALIDAGRALAEAGYPCIRLDYYGTGDSSGSFTDFSPARAGKDIASAADKLRAVAQVDEVVLLGLRLGGTLALSAAPQVAASAVILWQPVISGKSFYDLNIKRQVLRKQLMGKKDDSEGDAKFIDLDGFPLSIKAADELASLDALSLAAGHPAKKMLLQISYTPKMSKEYSGFAEKLGKQCTFASVVCEPFWNRIELVDTAPVIEQTLRWIHISLFQIPC